MDKLRIVEVEYSPGYYYYNIQRYKRGCFSEGWIGCKEGSLGVYNYHSLEYAKECLYLFDDAYPKPPKEVWSS